MKNADRVKSFAFRLFAFAFVLCALAFLFAGCSSWRQLGETRAEARRRHRRAFAINQRALIADLDRLLLYDKPSKLADKRLQ